MASVHILLIYEWQFWFYNLVIKIHVTKDSIIDNDDYDHIYKLIDGTNSRRWICFWYASKCKRSETKLYDHNHRQTLCKSCKRHKFLEKYLQWFASCSSECAWFVYRIILTFILKPEMRTLFPRCHVRENLSISLCLGCSESDCMQDL